VWESDAERPVALKLLVVDDHELIRNALVDLLDGTEGICVVGTCVDGSEVLPAAIRTAPDVVLMDLHMPRMSGLEATRELLAAQPHVRVLVLSGDVVPSSVREARSLGAAGFTLKEEDPGELPQLICTVAAGGSAWSDAALAILAGQSGPPGAGDPRAVAPAAAAC
jgi:DNA-binding NarL/FixJ family response regulator